MSKDKWRMENVPVMNLSRTLCFNLAKRMVIARRLGEAGENSATFDAGAYHQWRMDELQRQFNDHFEAADLAGRDVLDFGCGSGALTILAIEARAKSVTGIDLNAALIEQAKNICRSRGLKNWPRFIVASDPKKIDLPDESIDIILCFDVLEHIIDYQEIIAEWRRVLRADGRVFIWWVPWLNPYGHHIESLVPLPWAHVFFSDRVLIDTCARIYDMPEFKPRLWDLDEKGKKKPNKWQKLDRLPDLNRLTIARFEEICGGVGLQIERREVIGFGGSRAARLTRGLTRLPVLRELFCSRVVYCLRRPGAVVRSPQPGVNSQPISSTIGSRVQTPDSGLQTPDY
jgi:ubiquinone/menaquinone biosynthesis C-methylase UbiE